MNGLKDMSKELKNYGFNQKERVYIYTGTVVGFLAPIVATKYLISSGLENTTLLGEAVTWGASVAINASSMLVPPHMPVPIYTSVAGSAVGSAFAVHSKQRRNNKKSLQKLMNEAISESYRHLI